MTPAITYGQLDEKLRQLGFVKRGIEISGKPRWVFEHNSIANAMIILPRRDLADPVEPFYVASVLATLRSHALLPECNPLTP